MTKQSDIEMVAKARAWAVKAHAGQKDKAGKDYFKAHVTVVAEGVKGDPIAVAVAFLHDTVEDTSVTIPQANLQVFWLSIITITISRCLCWGQRFFLFSCNTVRTAYHKNCTIDNRLLVHCVQFIFCS